MKIRADQRVGLLLSGVAILAFLSIAATIGLPATDASLKTDAELSAEAQEGLEVYRDEGLWQCAAPYDRETALEPQESTTADDVANSSPAMLGVERKVRGASGAELAEACGVQLSEDETAAVDAFLRTR